MSKFKDFYYQHIKQEIGIDTSRFLYLVLSSFLIFILGGNMKVAINCFVSGRVQGVGFRAATYKQAEKLGMAGWVKNLADGRVEVYASGEPSQIKALRKWLTNGPIFARVNEVEVLEVEVADDTQFEIRY